MGGGGDRGEKGKKVSFQEQRKEGRQIFWMWRRKGKKREKEKREEKEKKCDNVKGETSKKGGIKWEKEIRNGKKRGGGGEGCPFRF